MNKISYIISPNGYGHFRRFVHIYDELIKKNINVNVYTNKENFEKYLNLRNIKNNFIINDCPWMPKADEYKRNKFFINQFEEIVKQSKSSLIISDNYVEPFLYDKNTIVIANFLFHEELSEKTKEYSKIFDAIDVNKIKICSSFFGMNYLEKFSKIRKFPLIGKQFIQSEDKNQIILSKGMGCWSNDFDSILLDYCKKNLKSYKGKIFIDQSLEGIKSKLKLLNFKVNTKPFDIELIKGTSAIIGRPSIGILTESFEYRIPFIPIVGSHDSESKNNQNILQNLYKEIGVSFKISNVTKNRMILKDSVLPIGGQAELVKHIISCL